MSRISQTRPLLKLVFTLDYEIFGDGSGSVVQEQCIPTEYLAQVLELHGGKLSIFVETGQQIFFNKHGLAQQAQPVEEQLRALYARGHDVQLHIHPMWFFAPAPDSGVIRLDPAKYDLSLLPPDEIESIVTTSIAYLKSVIAPIDSEYAPIAYRAGAWSMFNIEILFETLARHGIKVDSTIAPGAHLAEGTYGQFDFREFEMKPMWKHGPLTELPILTEKKLGSALFYANSLGLRTRRIVGRRYKSPLISQKKSKLRKLHNVSFRDFHMADFNYLSPKRLAKMIDRHVERNSHIGTLPVVLIGHSKSTYFADRLHEFFFELDQRGLNFEIPSLSDFVSGIDLPLTFPPAGD